jgi:hypothetical protein
MGSGNVTGQTAHSGGDAITYTGRPMDCMNGTRETAHFFLKNITSISNEGVDKPKGLRRKEAYGLEGLQEDVNNLMRNFIRKK